MRPSDEDKYGVLDWIAFLTECTVQFVPAIVGVVIGDFIANSYGFDDGLVEKPLASISLGDIFRILRPIVIMYVCGWIGWHIGKTWLPPVEEFFRRITTRPDRE